MHSNESRSVQNNDTNKQLPLQVRINNLAERNKVTPAEMEKELQKDVATQNGYRKEYNYGDGKGEYTIQRALDDRDTVNANVDAEYEKLKELKTRTNDSLTSQSVRMNSSNDEQSQLANRITVLFENRGRFSDTSLDRDEFIEKLKADVSRQNSLQEDNGLTGTWTLEQEVASLESVLRNNK
jgi:hypothetical protein